VLNVEAQPVEEAHIDIGHPYKREPCNDVTAPALIQHSEAKGPNGQGSDVVREAVLAGEQVKEFPLGGPVRLLAFAFAELAWLAKNLLVGDGP